MQSNVLAVLWAVKDFLLVAFIALVVEAFSHLFEGLNFVLLARAVLLEHRLEDWALAAVASRHNRNFVALFSFCAIVLSWLLTLRLLLLLFLRYACLLVLVLLQRAR